MHALYFIYNYKTFLRFLLTIFYSTQKYKISNFVTFLQEKSRTIIQVGQKNKAYLKIIP